MKIALAQMRMDKSPRTNLRKSLQAIETAADSGAGLIQLEREKLEKALAKRHREVQSELLEENEHLKIQFLLAETGRSLGYDVFAAINDKHRTLDGRVLDSLTVKALPGLDAPPEVVKTISLIDMLWLNRTTLNRMRI